MAPSTVVVSLAFFCLLLLLLPAQNGASSHTSYMGRSRQISFKTPGISKRASTVPPSTCSSIATGLGNNKLPVVHRLSPCSPSHHQGIPSLTAADVLRRDTHRIRRRFTASPSAVVTAPDQAPAPSPTAVTIPTNGSSDQLTLPGALDYTVLISYGTPAQQFPMFLEATIGTSILRCKPCADGSNNCDPAFDTAQSSTFAHIACGSPECPTTNCSGTACPFDIPDIPLHGSFVRDQLTLAPSSTTVDDFRFVCLDTAHPSELPEVGILDLSRDHNSLPSRISSSSLPAFSYCLPQYPTSPGFLSFGGEAVIGDGNGATHAPLVSTDDPELADMYFIDLVGMSLGGEDIPIPAGTLGNTSTNLDVGTTFTMMAPAVYTPLRDAFKKEMSQYNNLLAPGFSGFDTCYNFTGLDLLVTPILDLKFSNGESLSIHVDQLLYYDNPALGPFTMSCFAFSTFDSSDDDGGVFSAVIGTYTLASTEVGYDVAGGKVRFIPESC